MCLYFPLADIIIWSTLQTVGAVTARRCLLEKQGPTLLCLTLTCLQNTFSIFVNGLRRSFASASSSWYPPILPPKKTFTVGNIANYGGKMDGSIMDLYIFGFRLSQDKISDLHKGQQTVKNVILSVS